MCIVVGDKFLSFLILKCPTDKLLNVIELLNGNKNCSNLNRVYFMRAMYCGKLKNCSECSVPRVLFQEFCSKCSVPSVLL